MTRNWKFGTKADGDSVTAFELESESGFRAIILDQGAILQSFHLPNGRKVALGFDDWGSYEADQSYIGRIIGPNANRILNATFQIDADKTQLTANDGPHNLHSGQNGFDVQSWKVRRTGAGLTLSLNSSDECHGFPGAIDVVLNISLIQNRLRMEMKASSNRPTPVNLTWHPYWNLSGSGRIDGHDLHIDAQNHTNIETRAALPIAGTRLDFRKPLPLGSVRLDTNYQNVRGVCLISDSVRMRVTSSLPDIQVYTGDALPHSRTGIALEPQYRPNDINFAQDSLIRPGELYDHWIEYSFDTV